MAGGDQGGFVAKVRTISTCEAWSEGRKLPRQGILAEALVQLEWMQVDPEDRRPALEGMMLKLKLQYFGHLM